MDLDILQQTLETEGFQIIPHAKTLAGLYSKNGQVGRALVEDSLLFDTPETKEAFDTILSQAPNVNDPLDPNIQKLITLLDSGKIKFKRLDSRLISNVTLGFYSSGIVIRPPLGMDPAVAKAELIKAVEAAEVRFGPDVRKNVGQSALNLRGPAKGDGQGVKTFFMGGIPPEMRK